MTTLFIPREHEPGERRVAATPTSVARLRAVGFEVAVEPGAGAAAGFADDTYVAAGATVQAAAAGFAAADVVLKVRAPALRRGPDGASFDEVAALRPGQWLIALLAPAQQPELLAGLAARGVTAIAMDAVPRITRAQRLDALSSMANVAGYRAVIEAAHHFPRFFAGQVTAAGKVPPCKVLVIGAGVAGLAAIGAARGLGAIVRAFDTRAAAREQVASMGAEFLTIALDEDGAGTGGYGKAMSEAFLAAERELFAAQCDEVDVVITTALIPGQPAPVLLTRAIVERMAPGSVIVDLAAERGGNCECTRPGEVVVHAGVTIVGATDLPSRMAPQASQLYATNLVHMLDELGAGTAELALDETNEIHRGALVAHAGAVRWPPPPASPPAPGEPRSAAIAGQPAAAIVASAAASAISPAAGHGHGEPAGAAAEGAGVPWGLVIAGLALVGVGVGAPASFLAHLTVFVLAIVVGWQVVWNVKPALHTPLMSVTNAISGIILIGGMLQLSGAPTSAPVLLGALAIFIAMINVAGGFWVTQRMLAMFQR